jgi:hypothetical protein
VLNTGRKDQASEEMKSLGQQLVKSQQELQSRWVVWKTPRGQTSGTKHRRLKQQVSAISLELESGRANRYGLRKKESIHANLGTAIEAALCA